MPLPLFRHALATLAYRGGKVLRDAPAEFATFRASETTRTPIEIVAHINDLLGWTIALADGGKWRVSTPSTWEAEVTRFFAELARADARFASDAPLSMPAEQLFQGPIADALGHVGQLAMLRRIAGSPVRGENFILAEIVTGRVSRDQAGPKFEFD